ncbi:ABC transporter substrate-binding protein [Dactylosporangium cerinum]
MDHRTRPRAVRAVAAFVISAVALGPALAACGSDEKTAAPDSIDVVTRWSAGNSAAAAQNRVFQAFTAETGIKVNVTEGLETIDDQVENAVAAGKSPDLVIVNLFDKTLGWLDTGVTVPADQYVKDWGLADKIKPAALNEWRVGGAPAGKLQGLPFSGFSWPLWYNSELLKKAGVDKIPATTDELIAAAAKLRAAGVGPSPSAATTGPARSSSTRSRSPTPTRRACSRSCRRAATAPRRRSWKASSCSPSCATPACSSTTPPGSPPTPCTRRTTPASPRSCPPDPGPTPSPRRPAPASTRRPPSAGSRSPAAPPSRSRPRSAASPASAS